MPTRLPFDVQSMIDAGEPRCDAWPINVNSVARIQSNWRQNMFAAIRDAGDIESCDTLLMASYTLSKQTIPMIQAATLLAAAQEAGMKVFGGPIEVDYLRASEPGAAPPSSSMSDLRVIPVARRPLARTLISTAEYNRWRDFIGGLISGRRAIVAHNPIIAEYLRDHPEPRRFVDSGTLFHRALERAGSNIESRADARHLVDSLLTNLLTDVELPDIYMKRLRRLMAAKVESILSLTLAQVRALASVPLPDALWGSSGGQHAARALAIQICRRGGRTYFAAHAGTTSTIDMGTSFALQELSVSTTFVLPTPAIAAQREIKAANAWLGPLRRAEIVGGHGLPLLRSAPVEKKRVSGPRPRVVYVTTEFFGFEITALNPLPDPIYLDWQLRLASWLHGLRIDLLCKPHPGGILKGRTHPLETVAPTSYDPFEMLMPEADVFVFDNCTTTTLWKSLGTDRPIVYFDMKHFKFTQLADPVIRRRCRFIDVNFDESNRPQFDRQEAEAAVLDATSVDPTEVQRLFLG
jgi:hypothetical protein